MKRCLPLLFLVACANGETAPPPPEPLAKPLTTVPTPGAELRRQKGELVCLPELPPGAEPALVAIQTAAEKGDLAALRSWLAPGVELRPERLKELAATLEQGCLEDESGQRVLCPPGGSKAVIERRPEGWRLVFFGKDQKDIKDTKDPTD